MTRNELKQAADRFERQYGREPTEGDLATMVALSRLPGWLLSVVWFTSWLGFERVSRWLILQGLR